MVDKIFFRYSGEEHLRDRSEPFGFLALRNNGVDYDGTPMLTPDCTSLEQLIYQAKILKRQIDEAVEEGKKKLK